MQRRTRRRWLWISIVVALLTAAAVVPLLVTADSGQIAFTATLYSDVIRFEADGAASLRVQVFDLAENELWDSDAVAGDTVDWDRTNARGERLANGYYLYLAQGWDAGDRLILNKAGKVVLLPGNQVELRAAPVVGAVVGSGDDPVMSPMLHTIADDLQVDGTITATESGSNTGSLAIQAGPSGNRARFTLTGYAAGASGDFASFIMRTDNQDAVFSVKDVSADTWHSAFDFEYLNAVFDFKANDVINVGRLTVDGLVESTSGGFRFPDGTVQLTAATVGTGNTASGLHATVGGGYGNTASGSYATVSGGDINGASGQWSTVGGGWSNVANGPFSPTVAGGAKNTASGTDSTVGGGVENLASGEKSTVGGGYQNTASGANAIVAGGIYNTASNQNTFVGGGIANVASGYRATVGGGEQNHAYGGLDTVGGGYRNTANAGGAYASCATVAGGYQNTATGSCAAVAGGHKNTAAGDYSFVVGRQAKNADAAHDGVFMFSDSTYADFSSAAANEFAVRASGGYRLYSNAGLTAGVTMAAGASAWSTVSDRNLKENFAALDGQEVLHQLSLIPITEWNYRAQDPGIRHIGPMAQDFYAAFGLGESDQHISTVDTDGIALVSIQALYALMQEKDDQIDAQQDQIDELRAEVEALKQAIDSMRD